MPTLKAELIPIDDDIVRYRVLCDQCEATHKSFPRRRESSEVPRDDWVPAYAGMTDTWEAHL
ncbi:MAG: hypothetical protein WCK15_14260 [Pirellula sp.]